MSFDDAYVELGLAPGAADAEAKQALLERLAAIADAHPESATIVSLGPQPPAHRLLWEDSFERGGILEPCPAGPCAKHGPGAMRLKYAQAMNTPFARRSLAKLKQAHGLLSRCLAAVARSHSSQSHLTIALIGMMVATGAANASPPAGFWQESEALLDDPRRATAEMERKLASASRPEDRFWILLSLSSGQQALEQSKQAMASIAAARAELQKWPAATQEDRAWFDLAELNSEKYESQPELRLKRALELRESLSQGATPQLSCEASSQVLWAFNSLRNSDEAWTESERLLACARDVKRVDIEVMALSFRGEAARRRGLPDEESQRYYEQALAVLGPTGRRFERSLLLWEQGTELGKQKHHEKAVDSLVVAMNLSNELNDLSGQVATATELARNLMFLNQAEQAWQVTRKGWKAMAQLEDRSRELPLLLVTLRVAARLHRADVPELIQRVHRVMKTYTGKKPDRNVAQALAEAHASLGQFGPAYEQQLLAYQALEKSSSRTQERALLDMQERFNRAQRQAETDRLRLTAQADRSELQAREASQRALWVALAALTAVLIAVAWALWQQARRRRAAAELAMRDELTGMPNRRAVRAQAVQALKLSGRSGHAVVVAMLDLDYFKRINDTYGHDGGDALLRAFAESASTALRGVDCLGRYGGEEWLLVMPGIGAEDIEHVFNRIRERFSVAAVAGLDKPHGCTFSMGAAISGVDGDDVDQLVSTADARLYEAKAKGRDCLVGPTSDKVAPSLAGRVEASLV